MIEIDRWPIADATEAQADVAYRLAWASACHVVAQGKRGGVGYGRGRVLWSACVPTADAEIALDALLALEGGDPAPAEALANRYAPAAP